MPSTPIALSDAHARACRVGVGRTAELRVDEDARRGERPLGARVAPGERFARVAADVAHGGDAAREPDLELVVDRLRAFRRVRPAGARAR